LLQVANSLEPIDEYNRWPTLQARAFTPTNPVYPHNSVALALKALRAFPQHREVVVAAMALFASFETVLTTRNYFNGTFRTCWFVVRLCVSE
jgi:hypothetical protein